jgi:hypothetical protein
LTVAAIGRRSIVVLLVVELIAIGSVMEVQETLTTADDGVMCRWIDMR